MNFKLLTLVYKNYVVIENRYSIKNRLLAKKQENRDSNPRDCPITHCLNKIGGKWKPIVLHLIREENNRFSMLQRAVPEISKQMLVNQLRELEEDLILERIIYPEIPPRVEYKISEYGKSLLPVVDRMMEWGKKDLGEK